MKIISNILIIISIIGCSINQKIEIQMETNKNVHRETVNVKHMKNNNRIAELIREMETCDRNLLYLERQTLIHKDKWSNLNRELCRLQLATTKWNDKRNKQ